MSDALPGPATRRDTAALDKPHVHVVLLTNFVPPYRLPLFEALSDRVGSLTVLVSTPVEQNRNWRPESGRLDLRIQRGISIRRHWRHPAGFSEPGHLHLPLDTLTQLRRLRPDVVISGELGLRTLLSTVYCTLTKGPRLIVWATLSERTEIGRGRLRELLRRWILQRAHHVIVNGDSGARYVERFGVPPDRIDRIPYVCLPQFGELAPVRDRRDALVNLLFVGQLNERKGLVPFLRALDRWTRAHPSAAIGLTVVGSGPQGEEISGFRPGPQLTINMLGDRDTDALPAVYAQADALVFPTLADEWGLVVNEALAAGVPVIGSVHSEAVMELCEEGVTGWLFNPEDPGSTESVIERALTTGPFELESMKNRARERVLGLTPEWAADRVVDAIRRSLD